MRTAALALTLAAGCAGGTRENPDLGPADLAGTPPADLAAAADGTAAAPKVVINELNPNGADPLTDPDWVELENLGPGAADLSGWMVRDDKVADATALPPGTVLAAGAWLVLLCDDAPDGGAPLAIHLPFKLSGGNGDEFHLAPPNAADADATTFAANAVPAGRGWGRLPDGTGAFALTTPTRGAANQP
jgi:hypothetical protein